MLELLQADLMPWRGARRWSCIRCGKCCGVLEVPVTYEEEKRLMKYGDVFRRFKIGVYLKKEGYCIFYDGKCRIYAERPIACRKYPFYIRLKGSKEALFEFDCERYFVYIDKTCRGIGVGFKAEKVIRDLIVELKNRKILIRS